MSEFGQFDELRQYGQQMSGAPPFIPEVTIGIEVDDEAMEYGGTRYVSSGVDYLDEIDTSEIKCEDELIPPVSTGRHAAAVGPTALATTTSAIKDEDGTWALEFRIDLRERGPADSPEHAPPAYPRRVYEKQNLHPGFAAWYEGDSKERRTRRLECESPPTDHERAAIDKINESIAEIGDEAGVDMRSVLQPPEEHHFFPDRQAYLQGVEMRFGPKTAAALAISRGCSHPQAGVLWTRQGNEFEDVFGLTHEKMHGVSLEVVAAAPATTDCFDGIITAVRFGIRGIQIGYQDLRTVPSHEIHGATEFVTDMAANKSMLMTGVGPINPTYRSMDILGGHAVLETARECGVKPFEIENMLIKGMWTPDRSGMEMMRDVLGDARFERFINLSANLKREEAERVAHELGWSFASRDLALAGIGAFGTFFNWRRRRYAV